MGIDILSKGVVPAGERYSPTGMEKVAAIGEGKSAERADWRRTIGIEVVGQTPLLPVDEFRGGRPNGPAATGAGGGRGKGATGTGARLYNE